MSKGKEYQVNVLDHFVLTASDIDKTISFYTRYLGMTVEEFNGGRKALKFGKQKINLHQKGKEFEPKADKPTPGGLDLCFLTTCSVQEYAAFLDDEGVEIIEGPIERTGAQGPILSIYIRDPDNNLIEISEKIL